MNVSWIQRNVRIRFWVSEPRRSQFDNLRSGVENNLPGTVTNFQSWRSHFDEGKHGDLFLCEEKSGSRFAGGAGFTMIRSVEVTLRAVSRLQNFDSDFNFLCEVTLIVVMPANASSATEESVGVTPKPAKFCWET